MVSMDGQCQFSSYVSLSVTDKTPPMVYLSICLQNFSLKQVISVADFINNLLRISLEHFCGSTLCTYI